MPRRERVHALIVGAGVAGISTALWLRDFGIESLLLEEARQPGGQLHDIHAPVMNYLLAYGWEGNRLAAGILNDARSAGLRMLVGSTVMRITARMRRVERDGQRFEGRALVLATGLRRRALDVPGERELLGHGVSHSANLDRPSYAGLPVVVVGGGTAAVEDAVLCAELGSPVTLIHRSAKFRARTDFLARARKASGVRFVTNARVVRIVGRDGVEGVEYRVRGTRGVRVAEPMRSSSGSAGSPGASWCAVSSAWTVVVLFASARPDRRAYLAFMPPATFVRRGAHPSRPRRARARRWPGRSRVRWGGCAIESSCRSERIRAAEAQ